MSFFARLGSGSGSDSDSDSGSESEESILSGDEGEKQDQLIAAASKPKSRASAFLRSDNEDGDSDEDSEDEDDSDDDDDDDESSDAGSGDQRQTLANRFLRDAASSDEDSDDEDKTVLLSAKDKRFAEMDAAIANIQKTTRQGGPSSDWVLASSELDRLFRFIARHQTAMLSSPIPVAGHIPPQFLQTITDLETTVNETFASERSAAKKMPAGKTKALSSIRQSLKKKAKEFENFLPTFVSDPAAYTAAYEAANRAPAVPKAPKKAAAAATADEAAGAEDFTTIGKGGKALNLTPEGVFKTLKDIVEQRGRKNTDRGETIRILQKLLEVSNTTYQRIRVYLALIPARLDYSQNLVSIPHDSWVSCRQEYDDLISLLLENSDYAVQDQVEEYDDMVERQPEEKDGVTQKVRVAGNLISMLENLDNEFTKTLQHTDANEKGSEYIERLRAEVPLYATIVKAQILFERDNAADQSARAVMRRLEHVYAKPDAIVVHFETAMRSINTGLDSRITPFASAVEPSKLLHDLAIYIYSSDAPLMRARAILAHIYHHAMQGRYHQARDLLLMSHLQDTVQHADVTTQILYNRSVMQLGLAAFRKGYISECQAILSEMFSTQRPRELLAQSIQRYNTQLSPEQELIEKRRLLPFHLHLNIELLEAAYLTSCMLIEIPRLASVDTEEQRRRIASKTFKRLLDNADKSAFMGPPESTRDHVIKASKALAAGDWEAARDLLLSTKIWGLLDDVASVKDMLAKRIQEEGLRTYLFTYSNYYASLSLSQLSTAFSLPTTTITSIISRMIYTDELQASLDQVDQVVVFHRVEQSEVQRLAQQLADRAVAMVEQNEKTLDQKSGQTGQQENRGAGGDGAAGAGGRTERRGGGRGGRGGVRGGRGRGFQSGLGGAMGRRVQA